MSLGVRVLGCLVHLIINNNNGQHLGWNVMCYCLHNFED